MEFLDSRTGTTVEDQEQWLFFLATNLFSGVLLVFSQDFWSQSDVTSVQTVTVTESSSNGEVWRDWVQSLVDVVNLFWLGVQVFLVSVFVVNTIFFTTGNTDFHF
ncbi:hypothetical protein AWRI1631_111650 [Saccharomyces cerevisiae AWRI1631]|uniref:Uncharacterized protein n=1 Tax=Saccharomyces cerevisiae (strain AWRI1631) TaxID=545124 RepID=B5VM97_YEAS6|nr:hypothetical protein AWRI1631_111650 [Saccharomyces cerevisiae AWRI1631]